MEHYDTVIVPTRVHKPDDRATVESFVKCDHGGIVRQGVFRDGRSPARYH